MKVVEDGIRHQIPEAADEQIQQLLMERFDLMPRWRDGMSIYDATFALIDALDEAKILSG